jgi:hypothetical protein
MLHQLETSSNGALFRLIQSDPDYFHDAWIALDGHIGLELPSEALERFRRHGLEIFWARTQFSGYFLPQGEATKRFDNAFGRRHWSTRALLALDKDWPLPAARIVADTALGLANTILRRLHPLDRGIGLCVALQNRRHPIWTHRELEPLPIGTVEPVSRVCGQTFSSRDKKIRALRRTFLFGCADSLLRI